MIFHIARKTEWNACNSDNYYQPFAFTKDKFIHCSTENQIARIARFHFSNEDEIILLKITEDKVRNDTTYENLDGGTELFPHIYRPIHKDEIERIDIIKKDQDQNFVFPEELGIN